jgi:hypothetical protein
MGDAKHHAERRSPGAIISAALALSMAVVIGTKS